MRRQPGRADRAERPRAWRDGIGAVAPDEILEEAVVVAAIADDGAGGVVPKPIRWADAKSAAEIGDDRADGLLPSLEGAGEGSLAILGAASSVGSVRGGGGRRDRLVAAGIALFGMGWYA